MKKLANAIAWLRSLRLVKHDLILGLRAVGAILLANTLVVPILTNGQNHYWWVLLLIGSILIIGTSLKGKDK